MDDLKIIPAEAPAFARKAVAKLRAQGDSQELRLETLRFVSFPAGPVEIRVYFDAAGARKCQLHKDWDGESDLTGHDDVDVDSDDESIVVAHMGGADDVRALASALLRAAELMVTLKAEYKAAV